MTKFFLTCLSFLVAIISHAQSKVFKEVSEEVSSEMKTITQDNVLVGYLSFTRLEKASEDSFNYKISVLDENLNDIGNVNFRGENLNLEAVSFEQDVLCLAYLKSSIVGKSFKNSKEYSRFNAENSIFLQFLTLSGKLIKTNTQPITLMSRDYESGSAKYNHKFAYSGGLIHNIQLKNISQQGFACFYGDKYDRKVITYDLTGNIIWQKKIGDGIGFGLLTSATDIYLLEILSGIPNPRFYIIGLNAKDGTEYYEILLKDSSRNSLKVLAFDIDPHTNIPYASGLIIDDKKSRNIGIFVMDLTGFSKKEINTKYIYWEKTGKNTVDSQGDDDYSKNAHIEIASSFRDFGGNTYFIGHNKTWRSQNSPLLLINTKGTLSYDNTSGLIAKDRNYYVIENSGTKENYIVTDDANDILIYSVQKKKIVRVIPEKDGKIRTKVFPAKEGHLMIVETNKKKSIPVCLLNL